MYPTNRENARTGVIQPLTIEANFVFFLQFEAPNYFFNFSNVLCLDKNFFSELASLIFVCTLPSQFSPVVLAAEN